jgi:hypothetical protein
MCTVSNAGPLFQELGGGTYFLCDFVHERLEGTDFGDAALHDKEIRVVDIELHALEDCLDDVLLSFVTV